MTREEAIYKLEQTKRYSKYLSDDEIAAIVVAIKALEQESVLDKIKAEIEFEVDHRTNMLCAEDVFEIIDKYKAESEDKK